MAGGKTGAGAPKAKKGRGGARAAGAIDGAAYGDEAVASILGKRKYPSTPRPDTEAKRLKKAKIVSKEHTKQRIALKRKQAEKKRAEEKKRAKEAKEKASKEGADGLEALVEKKKKKRRKREFNDNPTLEQRKRRERIRKRIKEREAQFLRGESAGAMSSGGESGGATSSRGESGMESSGEEHSDVDSMDSSDSDEESTRGSDVERTSGRGVEKEPVTREPASQVAASGTAKTKKKKVEQRTLESAREADETMVFAGDVEVAEDMQADELADHFADAQRMPKIVVTTSPKATKVAKLFIKDLLTTLVGAEYRPRGNYHIKEMVEYCKNREYTHLIIVAEWRKELRTYSTLPTDERQDEEDFKGAFHWREVDDGRQGLAQTSDHLPELVLNNFNTRLGHNVGRVFASVFPQMAEFHGRRVVTFHNQRDFIFFRHHRYVFSDDGKKARLQEIGPRFTLKLKWLQRGTFDTTQGEYEWKHKTELDTSRRRFFL